ncbi:glycoside hydrolase family 3 protein [Arthrobacter sp. HLT1-20]
MNTVDPQGQSIDKRFRDASLPLAERVEFLLDQMTLEEKAGLFFPTMVMPGENGSLDVKNAPFELPHARDLLLTKGMTHVNVLGSAPSGQDLAAWHNSLQELAASTRLGIPVTLSTDPRHHFSMNPGTSMLAGPFSQRPETLGFAALSDEDTVETFADIARQENAELTGKHFPGGGPQCDGEDPHFAHGREQVYPGNNFDCHLKPFEAAFRPGTSQLMPYYGMPVADRMVKVIEAGVDQFGGEDNPELLVDLVREGRIAESRLDESARRLLREKFALGLFDAPFVDEDAAGRIVGNSEFRAAGEAAQREALTVLRNAANTLPLKGGLKIYVEGFAADDAAGHLGELLPPGFAGVPEADIERITALCATVLTVVEVYLDRPAILTPFVAAAAALVVDFGAADGAVLDVLFGAAKARGTLPFELPSTMTALAGSRPDMPSDTANALFPFGHGIAL